MKQKATYDYFRTLEKVWKEMEVMEPCTMRLCEHLPERQESKDRKEGTVFMVASVHVLFTIQE